MTSSTVPAATLEEAFAVFHEQVTSRLQAVVWAYQNHVVTVPGPAAP